MHGLDAMIPGSLGHFHRCDTSVCVCACVGRGGKRGMLKGLGKKVEKDLKLGQVRDDQMFFGFEITKYNLEKDELSGGLDCGRSAET